MKNLLILTLTSLVLLLIPISKVSAQEDTAFAKPPTYKAVINNIEDTTCDNQGFEFECTVYTLEITSQQQTGQIIESIIENSGNTDPQSEYLSKGDAVFVQEFKTFDQVNYIITGPVRETPIALLTGLFVLLILIIGRLQGIGSIIGLVLSIFILFGFVTPSILEGKNEILIGYIGAGTILITSIFLSHGINRKSITALVSSLGGLIIISILTAIFLNLIKLTGFGADDAINLYAEAHGSINMKGILFASIIIGGIGVMDDITINQVSALEQLFEADKKQTWKDLYKKAMVLGRDHISSLVNTLFIAYASASMPLVMLLQATDSSLTEIINSDQFAEEIVRTIIGSMGLILVVPISSLIGAYLISNRKLEKIFGDDFGIKSKGHYHPH